MNNLKGLSIEEFRNMVNNLVNDPTGDIKMFIDDGRYYQNEIAKFDMDFARKVGLVVSSIEDLVAYAKVRREFR